MGQGTSIWIVPSSQQSRESQPGTALSSPGQRGRQPQRSQQNHRPPGQWALLLSRLGLAPSVLLPESKKAFLCCFWQEEFSKDNLMGSTSQQTAAAGDSSTWKVHLPSDASQSLTYIPHPHQKGRLRGCSRSLGSINLLGGVSSQGKKLIRWRLPKG